jgi:hypothetical protein
LLGAETIKIAQIAARAILINLARFICDEYNKHLYLRERGVH